MTTTARDAIAEILARARSAGAFAAMRTAQADDLCLEVDGLGPLHFPISRAQAQRLCRLSRRARYGRGEKTLFDTSVRDTWEVPKSRIRIERTRWSRTLLPMLESLRADLGLPSGTRLKAEMHSMLVYGPGQFFLPHQDSEKNDDMVGTLVVALPSPFRGGAMVIEHQNERLTFRAPRQPLSFLAFYADCRHEVRPVRDGYRIVLTYDLSLVGDGRAAVLHTEVEARQVGALAARLRQYFETPLPSAPRREKPAQPPKRLVYLLDHEYTERGLGWQRLKGDDAARAAMLSAAAERADCDVALALADVQETWSCWEDADPRAWRDGRWDDEEEELADEEDPGAENSGEYELGDLQDWNIELRRWIAPSGTRAEPIGTWVRDHEVCSTIPSSDLVPYKSEYEGYMGNWGNTMDRWYRRGAIVVWLREHGFAVRAEASPAWALDALLRRIRSGDLAEARTMAESLVPFWKEAAATETRRDFFDKALRAAVELGVSPLAASLLQPFHVERLGAGRARPFASLVERYGEPWTQSLLAKWSAHGGWGGQRGEDRYAWLATLPRLCDALRACGGAGPLAARLLLPEEWTWLEGVLAETRHLRSPSERDQALGRLARPVLGWLQGAGVAAAGELRDRALAVLCAAEDDTLLPCLVQALRAAPEWSSAAGLDVLGRHCAERLAARLAQPARARDDWSIALPADCRCGTCTQLREFLADSRQQRLEWPLVQERRRHVHQVLDAHEMPVRHRTRRSGRPYTLVLEKMDALFAREAGERRRWRADLDSLTSH
jgi:hypothetical protein